MPCREGADAGRISSWKGTPHPKGFSKKYSVISGISFFFSLIFFCENCLPLSAGRGLLHEKNLDSSHTGKEIDYLITSIKFNFHASPLKKKTLQVCNSLFLCTRF